MTELLIEVTRDRRTSSVTGGEFTWVVESGVCDCVQLRSLCALSALAPFPAPFPPPFLPPFPPPLLRALSALSPPVGGCALRRSQLLAKVLRRRLASNAGRGVGRCASLFTHSSLTLHSLFTHSSLTLACSTRCVACSPLSPAERLQASTLRSWKETKPVTSAVSSWRSISVQPSMQTRTFRSCCIALTLSARSASSSGGSCKGSGLK